MNHKKRTLEDFINLTRQLASQNDVKKLLGEIIKESIRITQAEGGKIYLPDITKKYFELKHVCIVENFTKAKGFTSVDDSAIVDDSLLVEDSSIVEEYHPVNDSVRVEDSLLVEDSIKINEINIKSASISEKNISRVFLQENGVLNSNNYLIYTAITGSLLELKRNDNFSSYQVPHLLEFDQAYASQTESVLVMSLCDHEGITIGLLELYNYSLDIDRHLLNAFSSLSAVLINNANLVSHNNHLIHVLDESYQALENENYRLKQSIVKNNNYEIIGQSNAMMSVFSLLDKVANSNITVFLRGETGTGKEIFARAIHKNSARPDQPLISQNCAALPEALLESELFGYKKGAFTGATQDKLGLFDQANGGTIFLDEIGDMPINLQAKVLRVIQEKEIRPLGATSSHKIDVRLITATHCDLEKKIVDGEFRQDLFYRLNIFPIMLPRLCDRENDVILLINYFVKLYSKTYQRNIKTISPNVMDILMRYQYPGNVRELQNIIERSIILCDKDGILLEKDLPEEVTEISRNNMNSSNSYSQNESNVSIQPLKSLKCAVQNFEARLIKFNLRQNNWNQTLTAQILKLPRRTLVEKISRLNIIIPK